MIGEIDYVNILETYQYKVPFFVYMLLTAFLFLVPVMANMVIGLAVHDIRDLIKEAKTTQILKQASYVHDYETIVVCLKKLWCFPETLRKN